MDIETLIEMNSNEKIYIGYWRKSFFDIFSGLPFPVSSFMKLEQTDIIDKSIEILYKFGLKHSFFGFSKCRLCNLKNGTSEFLINYNKKTYIIHEGYFHYIKDHNVKIDNKLVEIVNYYSNKL